MARVLMVIPPERFRDEELFETKEVLQQAGHTVSLASTKKGRCYGSHGGSALVQMLLGDADADAYEAVVFVGGGGATLLYEDQDARWIAQRMHAAGQVVAAICLAPAILANAGVLKGKNATVAATETAALEAGGATYAGPAVTVDGNIVTANGPKSSKAFGEAIVQALSGEPIKPSRPRRAGVPRA